APRAGRPELLPSDGARLRENDAGADGGDRPDARAGAAARTVMAGGTILLVSHAYDADRPAIQRAPAGWDGPPPADVPAALGAARRDAPDLVVLNLRPPGQDGPDLVRRLREEGALRTVPIIVLTERREDETFVACLDSGADDCLAKPCAGPELKARVRA